MSTSIFEKRWLDLVFEGKNKAYGAYQLRLENPKTTLLAMLYALLFIGGIGGAVTLLSSFGSKTDSSHIISCPMPIMPVHVEITEPEALPPLKATNTEKPATTETLTESWTNPEIVSSTEATPDPDPVVSAPAASNPEPGSGNTNGSTEGTSSAAAGTIGTADNSPAIPTTLQKQPMFPGGMDAFYRKIARDFEKPEMYDNAKIRIVMSFVIEKDGSMTDIRVLNRPGEGLEREAIRVLRSINKKWEPGIRNDQAVRTIFTLPIVIQPEQ